MTMSPIENHFNQAGSEVPATPRGKGAWAATETKRISLTRTKTFPHVHSSNAEYQHQIQKALFETKKQR